MRVVLLTLSPAADSDLDLSSLSFHCFSLHMKTVQCSVCKKNQSRNELRHPTTRSCAILSRTVAAADCGNVNRLGALGIRTLRCCVSARGVVGVRRCARGVRMGRGRGFELALCALRRSCRCCSCTAGRGPQAKSRGARMMRERAEEGDGIRDAGSAPSDRALRIRTEAQRARDSGRAERALLPQ